MSFWTPEREAELLRLTGENLSASKIGAMLGCSRNAIIGKVLRGNGRFGHLAGWARKPVQAARPSPKAASPRKRAAKRGAGPNPVPAPPAGAASLPAAPALPPIARSAALVLASISFEEAIERDRCLYFAGDPFGPSGPDMPVCGHERADVPETRYCARHLVAQRPIEVPA